MLQNKLLRYTDVSELIGLPIGTLHRMVHEKNIPHIRLGPSTVRFDLEQINQWLQKNAVSHEDVKLVQRSKRIINKKSESKLQEKQIDSEIKDKTFVKKNEDNTYISDQKTRKILRIINDTKLPCSVNHIQIKSGFSWEQVLESLSALNKVALVIETRKGIWTHVKNLKDTNSLKNQEKHNL